MPFIANLVLTGWIIGVFTTSLIMRFGQEAEVLAWSMVFCFSRFHCVFYPMNVPAGLAEVWLRSILPHMCSKVCRNFLRPMRLR